MFLSEIQKIENDPKHSFHVAASDSLAGARPGLPELLKAIARAPGSSFMFYLSERKLDKFVRKTAKKTPAIMQRAFVLCKKGECVEAVSKKKKATRISPQSFLLRFQASESAVCPGFAE